MSEHTVSPRPSDESVGTRAGGRAALSRAGAFVRTESGLARLALGTGDEPGRGTADPESMTRLFGGLTAEHTRRMGRLGLTA